MCKISYVKCVCFIFLVILAVLSCSGFRIDDLAMTDVSKRNFRSFSNSDVFLRTTDPVPSSSYVHRLRHYRQLRVQTHQQLRRRETHGHIDAYVLPPSLDVPPTTHQLFAQIPSTDINQELIPTRSIVTRSQRSSSSRRSKSRRRRCRDDDVSTKAYNAKIILRVIAESMSRKRESEYSVRFKVLEQFKNSSLPIHDHIQLTFSNSTRTCRHNNDFGRGRGSMKLVRADIRTSQEYVLFLNVSGAHNYSPSAAPEKLRKNPAKNKYIFKVLRMVSRRDFEPRPVELTLLKPRRRPHRLKLFCKAKGFPIPRITWRRNGRILKDSRHVRIKYGKRNSTLVIKKPTSEDWGTYECLAHVTSESAVSESIDVQGPPKTTTPPTPFRKPCDEPHRTEFCLNGGQCFMDPDPLERYCECPNGYDGKRCEMKTFNQPASMYPQTAIYTCKVGLSTKYFC